MAPHHLCHAWVIRTVQARVNRIGCVALALEGDARHQRTDFVVSSQQQHALRTGSLLKAVAHCTAEAAKRWRCAVNALIKRTV